MVFGDSKWAEAVIAASHEFPEFTPLFYKFNPHAVDNLGYWIMESFDFAYDGNWPIAEISNALVEAAAAFEVVYAIFGGSVTDLSKTIAEVERIQRAEAFHKTTPLTPTESKKAKEVFARIMYPPSSPGEMALD